MRINGAIYFNFILINDCERSNKKKGFFVCNFIINVFEVHVFFVCHFVTIWFKDNKLIIYLSVLFYCFNNNLFYVTFWDLDNAHT